jgi:hypothetical protein
VNTQGYTTIGYVGLLEFPPFDRTEERVELNNRLNRIPGVQIPERAAVEGTWPGLQLQALASEAPQRQFLEVLDWVATRLADKV